MKYDPIEINACLSIQRALLGEVTSNLRGVIFSIDERELSIRFYFDGVITELDEETVSIIETEIMADYVPDLEVAAECLQLDYPKCIHDAGIWVYARAE